MLFGIMKHEAISVISAAHGFKQNKRTARLEPGSLVEDNTIQESVVFSFEDQWQETHHNFPLSL